MLKSSFLMGFKTLLESINSKLVLTLLSLSIMLIAIHRVGVLDIEKDLLTETNHTEFFVYGSDEIIRSVSKNNDVYTVTCIPKATPTQPHCGLAFALHEDWPEKGVNIARYHSLKVKVSITTQVDEPRVRVTFRNFDPIYSDVNDAVSLKFNSISYAPSKYPGAILVPLSSFQVESWWVEERKIEFEHAHLDFSNVPLVEIVTDTLPENSQTVFVVHEAVLYGELITERVLIWSLIIFSFVTVCVLVAVQHYRLHVASITDILTGLYNRRGFQDWVGAINQRQKSRSSLTMMYFDIDDFKKVNDSYGHLAGDELLRAFCEMIRQVVSESKLAYRPHAFARLSGDEFALAFRDSDETEVVLLADKIMLASQKPVELSSGSLNLNFSLGIASSDSNTKSFDSLLSHADSAMYHAKRSGKGQYKLFDEAVEQDILFRKKIAEKLASAINHGEFHLVYMPILHTQSLEVVGCEVLLRCHAESLKGIGPNVFIPIAEQYDLIDKIDQWVLENSFKTVNKFKHLDKRHEIAFSVNISANQLHNKKFIQTVKALVKKYDIDTRLIEFEITETSLVETDEEAIQTLRDLKELGLSLSLDDFGTGYTAFNQLLNYPVDCLKIDKSFTDQVTDDQSSDVVMVNAILSIADSYKLKTTAEGIEHKHQLEYMRNHCCDRVQGYYFSKPIDFNDLLQFIADNSAEPDSDQAMLSASPKV